MTAWIALALAGVAETATSCVLRGHLLAAPSGYICVPEKNGNVAWSLLLLRANNPTAWPSIVASEREQQLNASMGRVGYLPAISAGNHQIGDIGMLDSTKRRILLVRDPYVRVLSAYLDKVVNRSSTELPYYARKRAKWSVVRNSPYPRTLSEFLREINDHGLIGANAHWAPQSQMCARHCGVTWGVLRVEARAAWLHPLCAALGIRREEVESGWEPFFGRASFLPSRTGDLYAASGAVRLNKRHHHHAERSLSRYYNVDAAATATALYGEDLRAFGYPQWDGVLERVPGANVTETIAVSAGSALLQEYDVSRRRDF